MSIVGENVNNLVYSLSGIDLTRQFEGVKLQAYRDEAGVWTIGYGHTLNVCEGMTCTPEQADAWLLKDIHWACNVVNSQVKVPLTQNQFDALVDFVFNCGADAFCRSTLLRMLNQGDYSEAANQFERWAFAGGKQLPGLLRRRKAERAKFLGVTA